MTFPQIEIFFSSKSEYENYHQFEAKYYFYIDTDSFYDSDEIYSHDILFFISS